MTEKPEQETVWVRRQWNDWRQARYGLNQIDGLHIDDLSGGINARSPRPFLQGYVWCDGMIEGELAHSCRHGHLHDQGVRPVGEFLAEFAVTYGLLPEIRESLGRYAAITGDALAVTGGRCFPPDPIYGVAQ